MTRKTGWPQEMFLMQDDCSKLSRWFASRIDARETVRRVFRQKKEQDMKQDEIIEMARQAGGKGLHLCTDPTETTIAMRLDFEQLEAFAKLVEERKLEEIAAACERLPFGDTAQSFAIWIREQA